jgi:phosphoribosylaminoimidazolecarboxamide formyltransferase/IMP cyclohydrolase
MPVSPAARIERALLAVSDKNGLAEFGRFLADRNVEILSTGGSGRLLAKSGVAVTKVSSHTGFPEILDGRVKTLHPMVHGGILARRDREEHLAELERHAIAPIDLVVVNLYPFAETVARGAPPDTCVETIDIGGPALIRAAAKNFQFVTVVTAPEDYAAVIDDMRRHESATTLALRRRLAHAAFAHTAAYDAAVARWMAEEAGEIFPPRLIVSGQRVQLLRYGENPHQRAALYRAEQRAGAPWPGVAGAIQLQGKELSYNNLNDTNAAFELVSEFDQNAVVIVKHANPCGVAIADSLAEAYRKALACDPVSAYGGIIAVNRVLDRETAEQISKLFAEVVIAPEVDAEARDLLSGKQNLRVLATGAMLNPAHAGMTLTGLTDGFLVQSRDNARIRPEDLRVVTNRSPSAAELSDLLFAFQVAKHVKSNAIVYAKDGATVGIGAGQTSRVDSARIAAWKARETSGARGGTDSPTTGSVVASDAFFPFADGLLVAIEAGATAVIQPGGSMRDAEVIMAADDHGVAMVFTGTRHFRH